MIRGEHRKVVPYAKLRQQRIDCSDLDSASPTDVPQFSGFNMVGPVGNNQWYRCEAIDDLLVSFRACKSLKQFLNNEPGREDRFAGLQGSGELKDFARVTGRVSSESE